MAIKTITFEPGAWDDFSYWVAQDIKTIKRIIELIKDIKRDPFSGIGKPEPLKYAAQAGYWSRRIDKTHRLVYRVNDETINIIACRHHYDKR